MVYKLFSSCNSTCQASNPGKGFLARYESLIVLGVLGYAVLMVRFVKSRRRERVRQFFLCVFRRPRRWIMMPRLSFVCMIVSLNRSNPIFLLYIRHCHLLHLTRPATSRSSSKRRLPTSSMHAKSMAFRIRHPGHHNASRRFRPPDGHVPWVP